MDHVDDITPGTLRFAAMPNDTIDALLKKNLLTISVLAVFVRHAEEYGMTLTKLLAMAGADGPRKVQVSKAYNTLIDERYVARVEFTYARPQGDAGRSGRRYSVTMVSRVPITDEVFAEKVRKYTPGKHVLVRWGSPPEQGEDWEQRRVKILASEVYCHLGAMRIDQDGQLTAHEKGRGRAGKADLATTEVSTKPRRQPPAAPWRRKPRPGNSATNSSADGGGQLGLEVGSNGDSAGMGSQVPPEVEKPTSGTTRGNTTNPQVVPKVEKLTSGTTCGNTLFAQVPPEVGLSTSIKKNKTEDEVENQQGGCAATGWPDGLPGTMITGTSAGTVVDQKLESEGDLQTARARFAGPSGTIVTGTLDMLRDRTRTRLLRARELAGVAAVEALTKQPGLDVDEVTRVMLRAQPDLTQFQLADRAAVLLAWENKAAIEVIKADGGHHPRKPPKDALVDSLPSQTRRRRGKCAEDGKTRETAV